MKSPSIGKKPSDNHIIWKSGKGDQTKRFHEALLTKWCRTIGVDFETYSRVDHDRGDEPRTQYQCVFSYQTDAGDSFDMGDEEWTIRTDKTPRTFVEIDEAGMMRIQGFSVERIVDVEELWYDGSTLVVKPEGEDKKLTIDAADLVP
jgi:hypothetical protein